ncbi:MAG: glycoside hydrolase family 99-like domain-containing protein [Candidatus Avoscillospira sp.]
MNPEYQIAAYYFPNWHVDQDYAFFHGKGWTEWEIVKSARQHFEGQVQPKIPLWGYEDESKPEVMARKIEAASEHAINAFVFDWYWKTDRTIMGSALEEGFLKAENNDKLKFAIMWANHEKLTMRPNRRVESSPATIDCSVDRAAWDHAVDYMIQKYFSHPSYWRIDERLYFQIYEINTLIDGLGGVAAAKDAITSLRSKVRAANLGEMKIDCVSLGVSMLGDEAASILRELGIDGTTTYVWYHHVKAETQPTVSYASVRESNKTVCLQLDEMFHLPYIPNVTVGWDPSPRCVQSEIYEVGDYPYTEIYLNNTPEEFEKALWDCKQFLDQRDARAPKAQPKILSINAWNEWTEGSYLEPDVVNGYAYLEAIRRVFG